MPAKTDDQQGNKLDQILGALTNLGTQVQDLGRRMGDVETKVKQQDMRTAKFEPMQKPEGTRVHWNEANQVGQNINDGKTLPVSATGLLAPYARVEYGTGTIVKLNPESETYQRLKARYDEKKSRVDPSAIEGQVVGLHYVNEQYQTKYRVAFPGLTREKRGDGFWDYEIIPA